ncbi:Talin-1 [Geranomyces michiganensis]|nr:Talin-1 [Geranomyces michiganensis]
MSHLSLKITVVGIGLTKTMQFSGDMSVHEVCREIREKFGDAAGGADHGLMWPETGKWLQPSKILDFYDMNSGDSLEYRKKHRALRVRTMDSSVKAILVDESLPVQQLVEIICERIGIQNPEEYSIIREGHSDQPPPVPPKGNKPSAAAAANAAENEAQRWLHPEKTLREQSVTEEDTVLLKKKFFFTDQNIDRNDPVQLNLMYNQAKDMITSGKHPCTAEEACQFGAIQLQVQFGNHEADKHKPGFHKLKEMVPPEYQKNKDVEKRIYTEHSKLQGLTELNAKFRYVQLSRSLKTYGITFFFVEDETVKKKKDSAMLLGVTKQSVVKLDPITKEIIREWRLTQLRRWAASPNSFTMDFGDYADAYFSVRTTEGEQISQLIAGYIDIIIKKRKEAEKVVEIDEEEQATMEEYVTPSRATNVGVVSAGAKTAVETKAVAVPPMVADGMRAGWGRSGTNFYAAQYGSVAGGYTPQMSEITGAQQTLMQTISNGFAMVNNARADMNVAANLPPLGNDAAAVQWKQHTVDVNAEAVASQITTNLAAAGSLINNVTGLIEEMDYEIIGANIVTMTSNLSQMAQGIKLLAGLQESAEDQERLLSAGREIANACAKLLDAAQPICMGQLNREDFHNQGREVAIASADLLMLMGRLDVDETGQEAMIQSARGVTKMASELIAAARPLAAAVKDPTHQQVIIADAKRVGDLAPALIACTSAVCPAITNTQCFDQFAEAAALIREAIEQLLSSCEAAGVTPKLFAPLKENSGKTYEAIAKLVEMAKKGGDTSVENPADLQYDAVIASVDRMLEKVDTVDGIVNGARDLTMISMQYVNMLKALGLDTTDVEERTRLLNAARSLGDATSKMVAAAKDTARNVNEPANQARLQEAVLAVRSASNTAASPQLRAKAFGKLVKAVRDCVASSNQLISASRSTAQSNRNQASQLQLNQAARRVTELTPALATAMKMSANEPDNLVAQMKLMEAAKKFLVPGNALLANARIAAPTIADAAAQTGLQNAVNQISEDLVKLEKAYAYAEEASAGLELESAMHSLVAYQQELRAAVANPAALQTPAERVEAGLPSIADGCGQTELLAAVRSLQTDLAQLAGGVQQGNEKTAGQAATDAVAALQALSFAALALASAEEDVGFRKELLGAANMVTGALSSLLSSTKEAVDNPARRASFEENATKMAGALDTLARFLPGQREIDRSIAGIRKVQRTVEKKGLAAAITGSTSASASFQVAQNKMQTAASLMAVTANGVVTASRAAPEELTKNAASFAAAYAKLADSAGHYAEVTTDDGAKGQLQEMLIALGSASHHMLNMTKQCALDPSNAGLRSLLMGATKDISDSINKLLEVCSAAAPGHAECNNALQILNVASSRLGSVNDATFNDDTYGESIAKISATSKQLATNLAAMSSNARTGNVIKLANDTIDLANAIVALTEGNVRAAYLVGVADESSIAAIPPIVDQAEFSAAALDIKRACAKLVDPTNTQAIILEIAGQIAKQTAALCSACRTAGANTAVTTASKSHFLSSAKDLATKTSSLVATIKTMALNPNDETRSNCQEAALPLTDAVDRIVSFSMSSEFAGTDAKMGTTAAASQRPILDASDGIITSVQDLIGTVKLICSNPKDEASQQLLQGQSRAVVDAVKQTLQTVTSSAPGQKECDFALEKLSEAVTTVDGAIVEATVNNLAPQPETMTTVALADNVRVIASLADVVAKAAKEDARALGTAVTELPTSFGRVAIGAVGLASNMIDMQQQMTILDQVKALGEAMNAFVYAAKVNGGNGRNTAGCKKVDEERAKFRTAINKLVASLEGSRDESGEFTKAVEAIEMAVAGLEGRVPETVNKAYHLFEEEMDIAGKQIVGAVGDAISKVKTPAQFRQSATQFAVLYDDMCSKGSCAVRATGDQKVKDGIQDGLRALGASSVKLIEALRHASGKSAADQVSRNKLSAAAREVSSSVASLMATTKEGSKGLLLCKTAMENINGVIAEIEGNIIFASAGQLDPVDSKDNFARHKDPLLSAARAATEAIKAYITAVGGTQDELGAVATASVAALEVLRNHVRSGAVSVTSADKHMQQQLLGSAKSVAEGLQALIGAAINACGRAPDDPVMIELAEKVKIEFLAMRELIRATRVLGDEATRGTRALEGAMAEIDLAIGVLQSKDPAQGTALPEEVAGSAKQLATAAANLVSASSRAQDELVSAANAIKKQLEDLVRAAKAATEKAPAEQKAPVIDAVQKAGLAVKSLLSRIKVQQEFNTSENKTNVQVGAKDVAMSVNSVVNAASALLPAGYVDVNDPNVIAERELLAAAASIEAAARKLAALQPPPKPMEANEDLNFEGQILEAAKAIAAATAALVRSATGAQRDLVARGRTGPKEEAMYFSDGTWSDGLVSAAKMVAGATSDLCETANQAMKGKLERERVVVGAKAVSASTAQLLSAATARADPNSQAQIRLRAAAKSVTTATESLVRAAEQNMAFEDAEQFSNIMSAGAKGSATQSRVAEMDAQVAILKMEKELERARLKLASVRKGKYDAAVEKKMAAVALSNNTPQAPGPAVVVSKPSSVPTRAKGAAHRQPPSVRKPTPATMMALQPDGVASRDCASAPRDGMSSERLVRRAEDLPLTKGAGVSSPPQLVDSAYVSQELLLLDDDMLPWGDGQKNSKEMQFPISPRSFGFRQPSSLDVIEETGEGDTDTEEGRITPSLTDCADISAEPPIPGEGVPKRGLAHRYRPRIYSQTHQPLAIPTEAEAAAKIPYILDAKSLIEFWRYPCESHTTQTADGYILTMHRIPNPQHGFTSYSAPTPYARPPVVLWHGLCINSAAFVCSPGGTETNLALFLASEGFDVWLANGRGSMASRKHAHLPSAEEIMFHSKYWGRCGMDEMAAFDVPAVVNYVLRTTGWSKVGYVGFSQGTAQMFMSLAMSEEMNEKIAVFVGLAPALKPKPVMNVLLATATRVLGPSILFGLGSWSALPAAEWMRNHLVSFVYARVIHHSIYGLLGWKNDKFPVAWWPAMYTHLYGGGSVRNLVHWFKIMAEQTFTPYDHERTPHVLPNPSLSSPDYSGHKQTYAPGRIGPCAYPTHHITTPIRLFCGGNDNISENAHYTTAFGPNAKVSIVQDYEHMDLIWARDARSRVWEDVVESLTQAMTEVEPRRPSDSDPW